MSNTLGLPLDFSLEIFSPLEQFEVYKIISLFFILPINNFMVFCIFLFVVGIVFTRVALLEYNAVGFNYILVRFSRCYLIFEYFYNFCKSLVKENINEENFKYLSLILTSFFLILGSNLIGMVPYSFTLTSHIFFTFSVALVVFIGLNIIGYEKHGIHFLNLFLPNGAPLLLAPLLVIIELVSYIARVFSLSIRLFANMMSGHTLLKILAGFGWTMLTFFSFWFFIGFVPIFIVFLITGLELAIAFLQAYVFVVLICIYFNDVIYLH